MSIREKNTKERILDEALKLFAQRGYMGTSMNDIADRLEVTKAALYKHYKSKQEILYSIVEKMNRMDQERVKEYDILYSIVEKMNRMDQERVKEYDMPEGNMKEVVEGYRSSALDKIKEFTKVQFLHWTKEEFPCCFRKMLTLEQYRDPEMAKLYQNYLSGGPLAYIENVFQGLTEHKEEAKQLALDFYGPIFLLYSIYDGAEDKEKVTGLLEKHVERFSEQFMNRKEGIADAK